METPDSRTSAPLHRRSTSEEPGNSDLDRFSRTSGALRFRECLVEPNARLLLRHDQAINIGSRAFDLLMVLLRSRGRVVSKAEIFRYVWPDTQVDESNLRFQMAALRSAIGDYRNLIKTIPGRGYLFVEEDDARDTSFSFPVDPVFPVHGGSGECGGIDVVDETDVEEQRSIVAIIDDSSEIREALEGLFQSAGLEVETFSSVQDYANRDWSFQPSCLVLDVFLPGQNGLDFQAEMRTSGSNVPVVFITGHADVHMGVQAMKAGAFDFLTKPVRHRDLLDAVRLASSSVSLGSS